MCIACIILEYAEWGVFRGHALDFGMSECFTFLNLR